MKTVNDIVKILGGTGKTADIVGVLPSAVSNWKRFKFIPSRHYFKIYRECEKRGYIIPDELFIDYSRRAGRAA
jgi:hypothetical protein